MPLMSSRALAVELDSHEETIRRLYRSGLIPGYKCGRVLRFDPAEVRAALRSTPPGQRDGHAAVEPDFDAIAVDDE